MGAPNSPGKFNDIASMISSSLKNKPSTALRKSRDKQPYESSSLMEAY